MQGGLDMIVNCCATCTYGEYNTKKSKTLHCIYYDNTRHQLETCNEYKRDMDKVDRIEIYLRGVR